MKTVLKSLVVPRTLDKRFFKKVFSEANGSGENLSPLERTILDPLSLRVQRCLLIAGSKISRSSKAKQSPTKSLSASAFYTHFECHV